jgi:hypothetical protein
VPSHFVELEFQGHVFAALGAIVTREASALHGHVLAHVYAPRIVGVAGEEPVGADLNTVGPDVVIVIAVVPAVSVGAHDWCDMGALEGGRIWR